MKLRFAVAAALSFMSAAALAQISQPLGYLSAASTNSTLVKTGPGQVTAIALINTTTSPYVFKLYDKATAPTCGTDTPVWRIPIPATTSGGVFSVPLPAPLQFINGIGFCLTANFPDSNNGNAAVGITINLGVK